MVLHTLQDKLTQLRSAQLLKPPTARNGFTKAALEVVNLPPPPSRQRASSLKIPCISCMPYTLHGILPVRMFPLPYAPHHQLSSHLHVFFLQITPPPPKKKRTPPHPHAYVLVNTRRHAP